MNKRNRRFEDHLGLDHHGCDTGVQVQVILQLTVSQPVPSWCRAPSGAHDQILLCHSSDSYGPSPLGAPHLTRGWVCHLYNYTYGGLLLITV
jgi:hypothetical protein